MTQLLDTSQAGEISRMIIGLLSDEGFQEQEIIPGLIQAVVDLARTTNLEEQLLDEAANFLADGGMKEE